MQWVTRSSRSGSRVGRLCGRGGGLRAPQRGHARASRVGPQRRAPHRAPTAPPRRHPLRPQRPGDRDAGAAADVLCKAGQARGIEDSMSSLSRRRSNRCACPPPAPRAHSFSPPIRRPSAHVIASRAHALTRLALFAGNLAVATRPMDPSPSFYIIFWVRPSAPSPKPMPTAPPDHRAPMLPQAAGALL